MSTPGLASFNRWRWCYCPLHSERKWVSKSEYYAHKARLRELEQQETEGEEDDVSSSEQSESSIDGNEEEAPPEMGDEDSENESQEFEEPGLGLVGEEDATVNTTMLNALEMEHMAALSTNLNLQSIAQVQNDSSTQADRRVRFADSEPLQTFYYENAPPNTLLQSSPQPYDDEGIGAATGGISMSPPVIIASDDPTDTADELDEETEEESVDSDIAMTEANSAAESQGDGDGISLQSGYQSPSVQEVVDEEVIPEEGVDNEDVHVDSDVGESTEDDPGNMETASASHGSESSFQPISEMPDPFGPPTMDHVPGAASAEPSTTADGDPAELSGSGSDSSAEEEVMIGGNELEEVWEDEEEISSMVDWYRTGLRPEALQRLHASDPKMKLAMNLAQWRTEDGISNGSFERLRRLLGRNKIKVPRLKRILKDLQELTGIYPQCYDVCPASHVMFVGPYREMRVCPTKNCGKKRYQDFRESDDDDKYKAELPPEPDQPRAEPLQVQLRKAKKKGRVAQKHCLSFPVLPTLRLWWQNPDFARLIKERRLYHEDKKDPEHPKHGVYEDFMDGKIFNTYLKEKKVMTTLHSLAFTMLCDGFCILRYPNQHNVFPFLLLLQNVPPELRVRKEWEIIPMIVPGPNEPTDLTSWTYPIMQEFKILHNGKEMAVDGETKETFLLRAWIVGLLGDQKALNLMLQMSGASAKRGCRECWIEGVRFGKLYYYDSAGKELTTRAEMRKVIRECKENADKHLQKELGIRGYSPFTDMPGESVHFHRGAPYGPIHAIIINQFASSMVSLWRGKHSFDLPAGRERSRSRSRASSRGAGSQPSAGTQSSVGDLESASQFETDVPPPPNKKRRRKNPIPNFDGDDDDDGYAASGDESGPSISSNSRSSRKGSSKHAEATSGAEDMFGAASTFVGEGYEVPDYVLPKSVWQEIGRELVDASKTVPAAIARGLRDISVHGHTYSASAWTTFILVYSVPIMTGRLPDKYVRNLLHFVEALELMFRRRHTDESIAEVGRRWDEFVCEYTELYVKYRPSTSGETGDQLSEHIPNPERIKLLTSNLHALRHMSMHLEDFGSMSCFWEYPIERLGTMLKRMAKSKLYVSEGILNSVMQQETMKVAARAYPELGLRDRLAEFKQQPQGAYPTDEGFLLRRRVQISLDEDMWASTRILVHAYVKQLARGLSRRNGEIVYRNQASLYERYKKGEDGHIVGSARSQLSTTVNRASQFVRIKAGPGRTGYEYGCVEFFLRLFVQNLKRKGPYRGEEGNDLGVKTSYRNGGDSDADSVEGGVQPRSDGVSAYDRQFEHYVAVVTLWETEVGGDAVGGTQQIKLLKDNVRVELIDVRRIDGLVGRFVTRDTEWVVSPGLEDSFNLTVDHF